MELEQNSFTEGVAGSSVANVLLVVLFFIGKFVRERCKKSKCASHIGICDCDTELEEVRAHTQRAASATEKQLELLQELHRKIELLERREGTSV